MPGKLLLTMRSLADVLDDASEQPAILLAGDCQAALPRNKLFGLALQFAEHLQLNPGIKPADVVSFVVSNTVGPA